MKNIGACSILIIVLSVLAIASCGGGGGGISETPCPSPPPPDLTGLWYGEGSFSAWNYSNSLKIAVDITQNGRSFLGEVRDFRSATSTIPPPDLQTPLMGSITYSCPPNPEREVINIYWETSAQVECCDYVANWGWYCVTYAQEGFFLQDYYYGDGFLNLSGAYRWNCWNNSGIFIYYYPLAYGEINLKKLSYLSITLPDSGQKESYTNIYGEDSDYLINAPSFTDNGDSTITDNVTGLMWQQDDSGSAMSFSNAISYCSDLTLTDYMDWRLPSRKEMVNLVDYGRYGDAINETYFPKRGFDYWTSSAFASSSGGFDDLASVVSIQSGEVKIEGIGIDEENRSKCVRGNILGGQDLYNNGDGTITDISTGLMWQQIQPATIMSFEPALSYCENLSLGGYDDWRLPNIKELDSIVLYTENVDAKIDSRFFPSPIAISNEYKSSTTFARSNYDHISLVVGFAPNQGWIGIEASKTSGGSVRCVRRQ